MSNFNFCPIIWHFCSKGNTDKLEKIHFRALKFIFQDFNASYEGLLERAGTVTLHLSRLRTLAVETFKIIYGSSPLYLKNFIVFKESKYNLRYSNLLDLPSVRTTQYGLNSFSYQAAKLWNALPDEARKIASFNSFKQFVKTWNGISCKCAMCKV